MIKHISILTAAALTVSSASAFADDLADKYFSSQNPTLTQQERAAIAATKRWSSAGNRITPVAGPNGAVRYIYGAQRPSIVCAVLQVCDVALQPGEVVNSIHLGDAARWLVEPAITGAGDGEVQHLIIKPMDVGLETSLVVTTNRRSYHLQLRSHRREYMPAVNFAYPDDALRKWDSLKKPNQITRQETATTPKKSVYLGDLSFDYEIDGDAVWKPTRVFSDGRKTIIEMPPSMFQTESPALLVVRKEGGIFTDEETVMDNYRVQGNRYIVDVVFDKAILVAGVGGAQNRVTITRIPKE
jgi:type IV secretion system protein VirB9